MTKVDDVKAKVQRMLTNHFGSVRIDKDGDFVVTNQSAVVFVGVKLWGDEDVIIPMSTCKGIQEIYHIPDSSVYVFRKAGHAANVEYPRRFARYLRRLFIEQP